MNLAVVDANLFDVSKGPGIGAISAFDAYWTKLPKIHGLPLMRDFIPKQIQDIMPNLMVKEVLHDPLDFQFRLVGAVLRNEFGKDLTGTKFTEIDGYDSDSDVWENNEFVVDERLISTMHIPYVGGSRTCWQTYQSSYPFSADGIDVDYIVTVIEFHPQP